MWLNYGIDSNVEGDGVSGGSRVSCGCSIEFFLFTLSLRSLTMKLYFLLLRVVMWCTVCTVVAGS